MEVRVGRYTGMRRRIGSRIVTQVQDDVIVWHTEHQPKLDHKTSPGDFETWCVIANAIFQP